MDSIPEIRPDLFLIRGGVCNTYVILGERITVVDPGSWRAAGLVFDLLQNKLQGNGKNGRPVNITCTHLHIDHISGLDRLAELTGGTVILNEGARPFLEGKRMPIPYPHRIIPLLPLRRQMDHVIPRWENIKHSREGIRPSLFWPRFKSDVAEWLRAGDRLPGQPDWQVIGSPGHSPDSVCFYNPASGALITGDTVFNLEESPWFHPFVQDKISARETYQRLRGLSVLAFYPGHGRPVMGDKLMEKALGPNKRQWGDV